MVYSVMSSKVEVRNSPIHGKGMFAKTNIEKGEVVFIKGGYILSKDELYSSGAINSYLPLDDNYFLAARNKEEELHIKLYNRNCLSRPMNKNPVFSRVLEVVGSGKKR